MTKSDMYINFDSEHLGGSRYMETWLSHLYRLLRNQRKMVDFFPVYWLLCILYLLEVNHVKFFSSDRTKLSLLWLHLQIAYKMNNIYTDTQQLVK